METIKWGILGPGKIANHFVKDLALVNNAKLTAVASRNPKRAKGFAKEYGIPFVFFDYEALFKSKEVDVIYIATPHVFHKDLAIQALQHGKHILCEKPLGVNKAEVESMIACAKKNGVFLMEALWSRFNPTIRRVKHLVNQGKLGELSYINADFAFYALDLPKESRLLDINLAGGTLLDIGIYPVFLAYLFFGIPDKIKAVSNFNDDGTEIQTSILFQYPKAQAILNSSFTHASRMSAEIAGSKGSIVFDPRFHETRGFTLRSGDDKEHYEIETHGRGYFHEILEVNDCIRSERIESELWSHQDSIHLISLLDEVRRQTGVVFPFET